MNESVDERMNELKNMSWKTQVEKELIEKRHVK